MAKKKSEKSEDIENNIKNDNGDQGKENIFHTMGNIFTKNQIPSDKSIEKIQPFLMVNWLSADINYIKRAQFLNYANKLPKKMQFDFAYYSIPKSYMPKFPKKSQLSEIDIRDIEVLMFEYKCSEDIARSYKKQLPPNEMAKIRDKYKNIDISIL